MRRPEIRDHGRATLSVIREESVKRLHASERLVVEQFNQARLLGTVAIGLLVVGFLLVAQWRGTTGRGRELEALSAQDLAIIVQELNATNEAMRQEASRLSARLLEADRAGRGRAESLNEAALELKNLRLMAGLVAAEGPGVRVTVEDVEGVLVVQDFVDMMNELRAGGAEAIAIDGVRLGARSGFDGPAGAVLLNGIRLTAPHVIEAIGDPEGLSGSLSLPGGLESKLTAIAGVSVGVSEERSLRLPAAVGPQVSVGMEGR